MMTSAEHDQWIRIARRYTRPGIDAEDVLQEALIAATRQGRADLSIPSAQRYFRGIIRKTAWAMRRADARRHRNELAKPLTNDVQTHASSAASLPTADSISKSLPAPDLSSLPTSLQAVANLVMAQFDRDEIRSTLGISDDALRRRLSDLRRHLESDPFAREQILESIRQRAAASSDSIGLIRQALVLWLRTRSPGGGAVGTIDPDGHLIAATRKSKILLTNPDRPATSG